jgi:GAF domain-containing protein
MGGILRLIANSPSNVTAVLQSVAEQAAQICQAQYVDIFIVENDTLRNLAWFGEIKRTLAFPLDRFSVSGRSVCDMRTVSVDDLQNAGDEFARGREVARRGGHRSIVGVPLIREGRAVGTIVVSRTEIRPFERNHIDLLTNFAAQAVIAIENARLLNELRQRTSDLGETLEQQTATSEILSSMSGSVMDTKPVFDAILRNLLRLFGTRFATVHLLKDGMIHLAALDGEPGFEGLAADFPRPLDDSTAIGCAMLLKQVVQLAPVIDNPAVPPASQRFAREYTYNSMISAPMMRGDEVIGGIITARRDPIAFDDKQIALIKSFAAQAVIAIENARLLNELRQSLEQQTATSEVLRVISSSPGELEPVFQAMLENATRICDTKFAQLFAYADGMFRMLSGQNIPPEMAEFQRQPRVWGSDTAFGRLARDKQTVHVLDTLADGISANSDVGRQMSIKSGVRTLLAVPMIKDNELVGAFCIYRSEVQSFTEKQISLVTNFAAQAVIAIENARLLNELRESLQQQTATADVLKVISRSTFDLQGVLDALVASAARLCDADTGIIRRCEGDIYPVAATFGLSAEQRNHYVRYSTKPDRGSVFGRAILERRTIHVPDLLTDPQLDRNRLRAYAGVINIRSGLGVPLVREETIIGVFTLQRSEPRPFTDKQIKLAETFADQAVVAMENARLLNELRQSLQQQTATADVLKVISRSTFDLQTVLNTLAESAVRLCEADIASIHRQRGSDYQALAIYGGPSEARELVLRTVPFAAGRGSVLGRTVAERQPIQISDVLADPDYSLLDVQRMVGFRTIMGVPVLREGNPIGVIVLMRLTVRPFSEKQIELATTFADQAGIAIENVRLFDEIQDKSRQLEEASQHKSQFLANMSHELRTPLNAILGYTELMADGAYGEPSEKMLGILKRLEANGKHLLGLINDVLDLSKIEAGQLELELSDYCIQDIAQTVRSTLEPLAADKKLAFKVEMPSKLPPGHGDGRRLTQVLINLVGNAIKFTDAGEVAIKAEANNGSFHVSVSDTGPGISAADQAKLFQEFQQADNAITRKKGGTGLGLAISKRIIEMHGGKIWVESQPGQGSTFAFKLPVVVEQQVEPAGGEKLLSQPSPHAQRMQ